MAASSFVHPSLLTQLFIDSSGVNADQRADVKAPPSSAEVKMHK